MSVFFCVAIVALLLMAGLVTDGGAKMAADRVAQSAASDAARAGTDVGAASRIAGNPRPEEAQAAASRVLADRGVAGDVIVRPDGAVHVRTSVKRPTVFLGIVGIDNVRGAGEATSVVIARR